MWLFLRLKIIELSEKLEYFETFWVGKVEGKFENGTKLKVIFCNKIELNSNNESRNWEKVLYFNCQNK